MWRIFWYQCQSYVVCLNVDCKWMYLTVIEISIPVDAAALKSFPGRTIFWFPVYREVLRIPVSKRNGFQSNFVHLDLKRNGFQSNFVHLDLKTKKNVFQTCVHCAKQMMCCWYFVSCSEDVAWRYCAATVSLTPSPYPPPPPVFLKTSSLPPLFHPHASLIIRTMLPSAFLL